MTSAQVTKAAPNYGSTRLIEEEISRFLNSGDPEVLCLQGKWGVGKTFLWNQILRDAQIKRKIVLDRYAYVSLFGVGSLEQLKYAIFENTVRTDDIGIEPSFVTFEANAAAVSKSLARKSLKYLQFVPGARDFVGALPSLSFLSVRKQIVCIDDLERKSDHLPVREVLGLISHLRDQRSCKVLLILNQDALEEQDKQQFEQYHEKSIDASLTFVPTAEDCVRIALRDSSPTNNQLSKDCVSLGIANIRIIKKIERFVNQLAPVLSGHNATVLRQAIQTTTVCVWMQFGDDAPDIEFIRSKRHKLAAGVLDETKISGEEQRWNLLLERVGFSAFDEFDQVIFDGIRAGYFDMGLLALRAAELNRSLAALQSKHSLESAWALYHDSFADNEPEVADAIFKACKEHVQVLSPLNLSGALSLLKNLGHTDRARELLEYYMAKRIEEKNFFNLDDYPFGSDITDQDVRTAFKQKYSSFRDTRSPADVLLAISRGSWHPDDVVLLLELTEDDLFKLFKGCKDKSTLSRLVSASLQFANIHPGQTIAERARGALKRIAGETILNRLRVKKFGIAIDH